MRSPLAQPFAFARPLGCAVVAHFAAASVTIAGAHAQEPEALYGDLRYPVGPYARALEVLDVDRDGVLDLFVGDSLPGPALLRGRGNGAFEPARRLQSSWPVRGTDSADIDHDGAIDVAGVGAGGTGILLAAAAGGFRAFVQLCAPEDARATVIGHFDADGHPDVAVLIGWPSGVMVFFGDGVGGFDRTAHTALLWSQGHFDAGDLDGDGCDDLVLTRLNGAYVTVALNDGAGQFVTSQGFYDGGMGRAAIADYDGDGDQDFAIANFAPGALGFYRNSGLGSLTLAGTFNAPFGSYYGAAYTAAVDFDADGALDALTTDYDHGVHLWRGNGAGVFTYSASCDSGAAAEAECADLDGDGRMDLVWPVVLAGEVEVRMQDAAGSFTSSTDLGFQAGRFEFGDWDRDGDQDLLSFVSQYAHYRAALAPGVFAAAVTSNLVQLTEAGRAFDLDGDGAVDVVVPQHGQRYLHLFRGVPSGALVPWTVLISSSYSVDVAALDLDGDADLDLVSANDVSSNLTLFRHDPGGAFAGGVNVYLPARPVELETADVDGDGREDVLVVDESRAVRAFLADGQGGLRAPITLVRVDARGVIARDLDGDSAVELVVHHTNDLAVWRRDAAGIWEDIWRAASPAYGSSYLLEDLDADGRPDLAVSSGQEGRIEILRNLGSGRFRLESRHAAISYVSALAAADVTGDGRVDLAYADLPYGTLRVLAQDTDLPGSFCASQPSAGTCVPQLSLAGRAQLAGAEPFITALDTVATSSWAVLFYGASATSTPIAGGTLCVAGAPTRLPAQLTSSSSSGQGCDATVELDWNRWLRAGHDPALTSGVHVHAQWWIDELPFATAVLSDGFDFTVLP